MVRIDAKKEEQMENIKNTDDAQANVESKSDSIKRTERETGAKVLTSVNFDARNKEIVGSSFHKAIDKKEALAGRGKERHNYAYLARLEDLIDRRGSEVEKRLWNKSVDKLIVKPEDIPESFWDAQVQIARNNSEYIQLTKKDKRVLASYLQERQRDSLRSWADYLGSEQSPYPLWFKVYAWDGMSKLGTFDHQKRQFTKRSKGMVAPYPKLNAAALAKLYSAVSQVYGIPEKERFTEDEDRDRTLGDLAKSANFNKLYSTLLLDTKATIPTPEKTEDVHGVWREYDPGDEAALAEAAEGTPWCIADIGTGRMYLGDTDADAAEDEENHAKFILFHLSDENEGKVAENASASIRLDKSGRVAEISGLGEGQALEDSLVPIVEEKVKTLPGGEEYLEAFANKKRLIELDHKFQNNDTFSSDDLDFIFGLNQDAKSIDTYTNDPRIREMRQVRKLLKNGVGVKSILERVGQVGSYDWDALIAGGAAPDDVLDKADTRDLLQKSELNDGVFGWEKFIDYGVDLQKILDKMSVSDKVRNFDLLEMYGADLDINDLASQLTDEEFSQNWDTLRKHHVLANTHQLLYHFDAEERRSQKMRELGNFLMAGLDDFMAEIDSIEDEDEDEDA